MSAEPPYRRRSSSTPPPTVGQRHRGIPDRTDFAWKKKETELDEAYDDLIARDATISALNEDCRNAYNLAKERGRELDSKEQYISELHVEHERIQQELSLCATRLTAAEVAEKEEKEEHARTRAKKEAKEEEHARSMRSLEAKMRELLRSGEKRQLSMMGNAQTMFEYAPQEPWEEDGLEEGDRRHSSQSSQSGTDEVQSSELVSQAMSKHQEGRPRGGHSSKRRSSVSGHHRSKVYSADHECVEQPCYRSVGTDPEPVEDRIAEHRIQKQIFYKSIGTDPDIIQDHPTEHGLVERPCYMSIGTDPDPIQYHVTRPETMAFRCPGSSEPLEHLPQSASWKIHLLKLTVLLLSIIICIVLTQSINVPAVLVSAVHLHIKSPEHQHPRNLTSTSADQKQQEHLTRCHAISALCQLFPDPEHQPFYTTALQSWTEMNTSRTYCPRPPGCSWTSSFSSYTTTTAVGAVQQHGTDVVDDQQRHLQVATRLQDIFMLIFPANPAPRHARNLHRSRHQSPSQTGQASTKWWWYPSSPSSSSVPEVKLENQGGNCTIVLRALEDAVGGAAYLDQPRAKGARDLQDGLGRICRSFGKRAEGPDDEFSSEHRRDCRDLGCEGSGR
ncbi:uncharacterized protein CLAFUR5_14631 [Fulvia fulva]|uniref:Uncharacterized protein n=1 Tax=Passalora fulva TaxID=5499 RepID=A0A9Q8UWW0_PASFU|nr:uncharacterized protein CLAFUR5_14631 [Fulvia fulva]KAK4608893.1 hypothetical protein CLAFUR0_14840 [Fulvia fulva]UJO25405.1 hypothetical protein CLAFUR5_14631 [Fulvia fulva]